MDKFDEDKSDSEMEHAPSNDYKQYVNLNEKKESDDEQRLSTSSSITNLQDDKDPHLILLTYYSSVTLIITSFLSLFISFYSNDYLLFFLYYKGKIGTLCLYSLFMINDTLIAFSLYLIFILKTNKSSLTLKAISNIFKSSFPIINFGISILFLIRFFLTEFLYLLVSVIIISICLFLVSKSYRPIKIKRELDIYTCISISIYLSVLVVLLSFLFLNNFIELILLYYNKSSFKNSQIKLNVINSIEFGMSFILLVYYKDIIIILTNIILFLTPQIVREFESLEKKYWDLLVIVIIGLIISYWMWRKEGLKLFNLKNKKEEKEMIKLKDVDTTTL